MECDRKTCKGHRIYEGGPMDGEVSHLLHADPSDYPLTMSPAVTARTRTESGMRPRYERDVDGGADVVYRFTGWFVPTARTPKTR